MEAEPGTADGTVRPDLAPFANGTLLKPRPCKFFLTQNLFPFFQNLFQLLTSLAWPHSLYSRGLLAFMRNMYLALGHVHSPFGTLCLDILGPHHASPVNEYYYPNTTWATDSHRFSFADRTKSRPGTCADDSIQSSPNQPSSGCSQ
jgi:hypothetical protein